MSETKITETEEKITFSETTTHDELSLIETYRRELMAKAYHDKALLEAPQYISQIELHIQVMEKTISLTEEKSKELEGIFTSKEINVKKRIGKIREKYDQKDLLRKINTVISNSTTEIKEVDGKFQITTITTNEVEDLLIEYMGILDKAPTRAEARLKEEQTLQNAKNSVEAKTEMLNTCKEKLKTIKEFFEKKGKSIDKLLDEQALARKKGKTAEAI